ncbi:conserved hypothetical protein [Arcobacter nitrofigilis DSM 7299]|uniref:HTH cro/C1-type domain-containing protein n=1 Tax=Arcobacter nitrofigilis (strain ATCC 33309 / DSM 7299 / CCUG 15893 / LMG 7604 / NCTC 12251 / CI) TaxID=572480 RepID=D5V100_ARCNC|nr:hypothetical protein [Arcobacter nitrofigilis]ADG93962.1 conserved hypothetical protein [Arcobacter nitrofigilis DSM 7299]
MKKIDVPQENNSTLDGQKKVMYGTNDNGEFQRINYASSVEEYATITAVEEYKELEKECLEDIQNNIASPIKYYMYKNRMDLPTLSSAVDMFSFRVKRHLKMKIFKKLKDDTIKKYADAFNIKIEDLKDFKYDRKL